MLIGHWSLVIRLSIWLNGNFLNLDEAFFVDQKFCFHYTTIKVKNILKLVTASLLLKIAYLFFAFIILGNAEILSLDGYIGITKRNDTGWYEKIATNWYPRVTDKIELGYSNKADYKQSEWAFFPFYPGLNRMCIKWFNVDFNLSGFIWSMLFSVLALSGFYIFCKLFINESKKAFYYSLVFLLLPFHYYFSMMYSEGIFLTFLIFSFISIHTRKYLYIPILMIPLVLARPNGIVAMIPLYLYFLEKNNIVSKKYFDFTLLFSRKNILQSLLFLTGPLAFIAWLMYQKQMTGYCFAFSIAQAGWYREFMLPFLSFFRRGDFATQFNSWYTLLIIFLSIFMWKKLPLSLNLLIWTSLLLPLCSGSMTSMPRFTSIIFPITIIYGDWFYSTKYKYAILLVLFSLQLFTFYYWLIGDPFGC